jgi:large subunit ribosomal protein L3
MAKGSMQYWQKRRAYRRLPRIRATPLSSSTNAIFNIIGYKVGMSHISVISESSKGSEVTRACTIIEVPNIEMYGIRAYSNDKTTKYKLAKTDIYDKSTAQRAGLKKFDEQKGNIEHIKEEAGKYCDIVALLVAYPRGTATGQHHPDRFESKIIGNGVAEKLEFALKMLGKEIKAEDVFKNGEYVDITAVSKGKGWQGVIKRFGVARLYHKATQKTRHVGTLGAFGMKRVLFEVPQSGQTGFNYRTEHNKRIIKIGRKEDTNRINPKSGFINYGEVKNDYIILDGSIPGPAKRLVRIRKSISNINQKDTKEPKITYLASTEGGM